jgi:hypothetical protein
VRAFIEAHPDLYNTKGGKGGGVGRLCDIPIKALPAAKAKRSSKKSTAKADEAPAS